MEPDQATSRFDPYASGLLRLCGTKARPLTLEQLLSQKQKAGKVSREPYEGHDCIVLHMSTKFEGGRGEFDIWFDPKVKYLACRLVGNFSGTADRPPVRRESQVLKFMEPAPGIFFPAEAETKFFSGEKLTHHEVVTYSEVRINQPLPADIFELPIPANATVLDQIQEREYKTDANGKETGPSRPLANGMPVAPGQASVPGGKPAPAVIAQKETKTEPEPMTRWILYGLVAVLAIAGGVWYVRRLRGGADSA
ncbi:MAG: hypothetical protein K8R36_19720 [Planctomycetales bacterium]|nr:hypothetical protein [Planctomycetales bacterium]